MKLELTCVLDMQLRHFSDQIQKLTEDKLQNSVTFENTQRRLADIRSSTQQVRDTVVEQQCKISSSRVTYMELQVEVEKERYLVFMYTSYFLKMFLVHNSF